MDTVLCRLVIAAIWVVGTLLALPQGAAHTFQQVGLYNSTHCKLLENVLMDYKMMMKK